MRGRCLHRGADEHGAKKRSFAFTLAYIKCFRTYSVYLSLRLPAQILYAGIHLPPQREARALPRRATDSAAAGAENRAPRALLQYMSAAASSFLPSASRARTRLALTGSPPISRRGTVTSSHPAAGRAAAMAALYAAVAEQKGSVPT